MTMKKKQKFDNPLLQDLEAEANEWIFQENDNIKLPSRRGSKFNIEFTEKEIIKNSEIKRNANTLFTAKRYSLTQPPNKYENKTLKN